MLHVSITANAWFLLLVLLVAAAFVWAAGPGSRGPGESSRATARWAAVAMVIAAAWLAVSAEIAATGILRAFSQRPPPLLIFLALVTLATTAVAFSPVGTRLVHGLGIAGLVGFQVFRVPVEFWLHRMYREGIVPEQMTFAGWNFDIVSGLSAAAIALWALRSRPPRWLILVWNLVALGLLINIVSIALLSAPTPLRLFHNEPANTFVAHVPFVWLPAFLVQAAWFGHLLVFRWLARDVQAPAG